MGYSKIKSFFFSKETHESFETHFSFVFLKLDFLYKNDFKKRKG